METTIITIKMDRHLGKHHLDQLVEVVQQGVSKCKNLERDV